MRFFIALEIPTQNLPQFQSIQDRLSILIPQARITDVDKIHLTIAFMGEQKDSFKDKLIQVIKESTVHISAFKVTPAYLDGFPNIHNPKVIWVGVKGDVDKILILRERIKDGIETLGLPVDERRFTPHITVAKLNNEFTVSKELEAELQSMINETFDPIKITSIKLFESLPEEGFHKHNVLAEIKLD